MIKEKAIGKQYGAAPDPMPLPMKLSDKVTRRARYHICLTDVSDFKNGNYRISVRDKCGVLREPDEKEFLAVRRREQCKYGLFNHVAYAFEEKI